MKPAKLIICERCSVLATLRLLLVAFLVSNICAHVEYEGPEGARIVGGHQAAKGEFPYQSSLQLKGYAGQRHLCGATLVHHNWIITAAHCVFGRPPTTLVALIGAFNLSDLTEKDRQERHVVQVAIHPNFSHGSLMYDMALLRVESPFTLGTMARPLPLHPANKTLSVGTSCIITGWGRISEDGPSSAVLRKAVVPLVSPSSCRRVYGPRVSRAMLCAGLARGGVDACQGDSGGPLACGGHLAGLSSWGFGCALPGFFGVYSHVGRLRDFVDQRLRDK